ncbi:hypothetical protein CERZMDRAFT_81999 [Cercospora zeae-maydis SCOH1-5]|uniref:Uncharacterized protein n=1 Tax=Cercospora zeae-maydis SCOH1-5 TaxID=717836 RepID=A0A6A6FR32_9PEZI|nr:hypothetical protein CERZMDRAFT_81999 [Cercospora zeae-maydis SCOH1-5]
MAECDSKTLGRVRILAIALPVCLISLFLACGGLLYVNRRRIVTHLYHKYNSPTDGSSRKSPLETKNWSDVACSSDTKTQLDCVLPDIDVSPSNKPDPYHTVRSHESSRIIGTPNFPGPRQLLAGRQSSVDGFHSSEKSFAPFSPRCCTPDTPLSRKDQLAHRSRQIQDTHARLDSISPEPPLVESPQAVTDALHGCKGIERRTYGNDVGEREVKLTKERPRSFSRPLANSSRPTSPYTRPISPAGSIRVVDRGSKDLELSRRGTSDAIGTRLDEVFVPEWEPVGNETRWTTNSSGFCPVCASHLDLCLLVELERSSLAARHPLPPTRTPPQPPPPPPLQRTRKTLAMGLEDSMWATPGAGAATKAPAVRAPPLQIKSRAPVTITRSASPPTSASAPTTAAMVPRGAAVNRLGVAETTNTTAAPVRTPSPMSDDPRTVPLFNPNSVGMVEAKAALVDFGKGGFAARKAPLRGQDGPPAPRLSAVPSASFSFSRTTPAPPPRETRASPAPSAPRKDDFVEQAQAKMLAQGKKQPAATIPVPEPAQASMMGKKHGRQEEEGMAFKSRAEDSTTKETSTKNEFSPTLPPHKRPKATAPLSIPTEAAATRLPMEPTPSALPAPQTWDEKMLAFKKNLLDRAGLSASPAISATYETASATINATIVPLDAQNAEHKAAAIEAEKALSAQVEKAAKREEDADKAIVRNMKKDEVVSLPDGAGLNVAEYGTKAAELLVEKERIKEERRKLDQAEKDVDACIEALTKVFRGGIGSPLAPRV